MRGLKIGVGFLLVMTAILAAPSYLRAQGTTAAQYLAAGNQYYTARNYTQAIQYFNASIKLNPNNPSAYQLTGNCYYALGNKPYALAYYKRASALQPNNMQLAQFVQNLQAQVNAGAAAAPAAAAPAAADPLSQGTALFRQKQYAAAIPYFQQATQANPNDYRGYYYAGYAYYMIRDSKNAALYFGVANAKQPNASIKAYADRIKASLSPDDQAWVDDQVSKYSQGGGAMAGGAKGGKKKDVAFGFHILGGEELVLSNKTQIEQYAPSSSMAVTGVAPTMLMAFGVEPFLQFGESFEINLAFNYLPVGSLSYKTYDYAVTNAGDGTGGPDVWKYDFNMTVITANLGAKIFFGGNGVKGYLGLSGGISPISMTFAKTSYDSTGTGPNLVPGQDVQSSGNYSTMAITGNARLGVDFELGKDMSVGPYVGFQYLSATNFTSGGNTLMVDTKNGAVGLPDTVTSKTNFPATDGSEAFKFDFSGITSGLNLSFFF